MVCQKFIGVNMLEKSKISDIRKEELKVALEKTEDLSSIFSNFNESYICEYLGFIVAYCSREYSKNMLEFVEELSQVDNAIPTLIEDFPKIFSFYESGDGYALVSFLNALKEKQPACVEKMNHILEENKESFFKILFSSATFICENPYLESLTLLVEELFQLSKKNYMDITFFKSGGYSSIYRIGDFVLKIGERFIFQIPSHPRILKPLLRRELDEAYIDIEVTRYVEPLEMSLEDIPNLKSFQIFCELMDAGIYWLDPKEENVGKVIPLEHPENFQIFVDNASLGLDGEPILEPAIGSYVIIDLDYIVYEKDFAKVLLDKHLYPRLFYTYLQYYQQMKERQKNERHK